MGNVWHLFIPYCYLENFPTSKKTSCSGGGGLDGDIELGNANGYNKIPDKLLHSASNVISDVTQGRPPQCELHKNIRNSNSSHDRSSTNLNNKNKNSSNNSSNISNNEVDDTFGNAGFKYNPQRVSEVAVSPKLGVRHVNKAGSRENCSYPSNTNNRPANRSVSNSPNSKSSSSPRCTNNNNNNSNSHRNSQTLKNNNNINNSPASSNSGRQRGDDRLHGSRNSGILDENKRVQSFDSDNREVDFFYDNLHCARDWYADSKTKNRFVEFLSQFSTYFKIENVICFCIKCTEAILITNLKNISSFSYFLFIIWQTSKKKYDQEVKNDKVFNNLLNKVNYISDFVLNHM